MLVYKLLDHSTRCESYLTLLENLIWNLDLNLFQIIWVGQFLFNGKFNHYQLLWLAVIWFFSWDLTFPFLSQSFTSIVGPNGSGKSNVIDSMLFVFGFRANKIRSKKISVLIHDSENHKNLDFCTVGVHFQKIIDTGVSSLNLTMSPFHWTVSLSNPYQHWNLIIAYVNIIFPKLLKLNTFYFDDEIFSSKEAWHFVDRMARMTTQWFLAHSLSSRVRHTETTARTTQ